MAIGANVVTGIGTSSPNRACAGSPSDVRSCGLARIRVLRVVLQQPVVDAGKPGEQHVGLRSGSEGPASVKSGAVDVDRAGNAGRRWRSWRARARIRAGGVRLTSSSSTSITTSGRALSIAAIRRAAAATCSGVSLIEIALVAVIGEICRTSTTTRSRSIDFLDVGVAQVERADDGLFVLAPLGRRVRDDRDRSRSGDAVERAGARGQRRERIRERDVAQIDRDRRVAERRDRRRRSGPSKRPIALNTMRLPALLNTSESGSLTPSGSSSPARRQVARSLDQRLELGLAFARHGEPGSRASAAFRAAPLDVGGGRIQLGSELELGERLFVTFGGRSRRPR